MPVGCPSVMPDMGNDPESWVGGRQPRGVKWATVAPVVPTAAGVLAMASGLLMWRDVAFTAANLATGVSFEPSSITAWSVWLSIAPAAAGALVAVVGLALGTCPLAALPADRPLAPGAGQLRLHRQCLRPVHQPCVIARTACGRRYSRSRHHRAPDPEPAPSRQPPAALAPGARPAGGGPALYCGWLRREIPGIRA